MKSVIILGLLLTLGFFHEARAQTVSTKIIRFEIDEKEVTKNYKIFFLSNGKLIEASKTPTGFIIPPEVRNNEYLTFLITLGKYRLEFLYIHISRFNEDWIVGIDKKPFSSRNIGHEKIKTLKLIYYIDFEGSVLETRRVVRVPIRK